MKKIIVSLIVLGSAALFVACDNSSNKTELQFTNGSGYELGINNITFAANEEWVKDGGYASGTLTESKEVSETVGEVECLVESSSGAGDFDTASVLIDGQAGSISLEDGGANKFTIMASSLSAPNHK